MRFVNRVCCSATLVLLSAGVIYAQGAPEAARAIAGAGLLCRVGRGRSMPVLRSRVRR